VCVPGVCVLGRGVVSSLDTPGVCVPGVCVLGRGVVSSLDTPGVPVTLCRRATLRPHSRLVDWDALPRRTLTAPSSVQPHLTCCPAARAERTSVTARAAARRRDAVGGPATGIRTQMQSIRTAPYRRASAPR
jgi:hypothetical protein